MQTTQLFDAADLTSRTDRLMLADAFEEAGDLLAAAVLRELEIYVWAEEELIEPECELDDEDVDWVRDEMAHNEWAWCCVTVNAVWHDADGRQFNGTDHLGCSSYRSEADFKESDYHRDMVAEAIRELIDEAKDNDARIEE